MLVMAYAYDVSVIGKRGMENGRCYGWGPLRHPVVSGRRVVQPHLAIRLCNLLHSKHSIWIQNAFRR